MPFSGITFNTHYLCYLFHACVRLYMLPKDVTLSESHKEAFTFNSQAPRTSFFNSYGFYINFYYLEQIVVYISSKFMSNNSFQFCLRKLTHSVSVINNKIFRPGFYGLLHRMGW